MNSDPNPKEAIEPPWVLKASEQCLSAGDGDEKSSCMDTFSRIPLLLQATTSYTPV